MQSLTGKEKFPGLCKEDLDSTVSVFEYKANICLVRNEEKLKDIPTVLSEDASIYYSLKIRGYEGYNEQVSPLRQRYKNSDKCARILKK